MRTVSAAISFLNLRGADVRLNTNCELLLFSCPVLQSFHESFFLLQMGCQRLM